MSMSVIVCSLDAGKEKKYRCPFCGFESDEIEDFATAMCWDCVYGVGDDNDIERSES